ALGASGIEERETASAEGSRSSNSLRCESSYLSWESDGGGVLQDRALVGRERVERLSVHDQCHEMWPERDVGCQPTRLRVVALLVDLAEVEFGPVEFGDGAGRDGRFASRAEGTKGRLLHVGGSDRDRCVPEVGRLDEPSRDTERLLESPREHSEADETERLD